MISTKEEYFGCLEDIKLMFKVLALSEIREEMLEIVQSLDISDVDYEGQ